MHSTELPVTEWWDPADEVYGVPPCPQGDGRTDANLWTEAFLFSATIGWIWADYDGYWGPWTRQLTTGADVYDITTHDAEACTICAPLVGPLFTRPPLPPCTCPYRIWTTRIVLPPTQRTRVRPRAYQVVSGTGFTIDPDCRHHGDAAADPAWSIWETPAEVVLDDEERRGH